MRKILVIDDEVEMGEIVHDYLSDEGYKTFKAADAQEGIGLVKKEKPDVVLLDVIMPGMSGLDCLKQIKKLSPQTFVIMVSALQDEHIAKQAIQHGAYDYLTKPFDLSFLSNNLLARIFAT